MTNRIRTASGRADPGEAVAQEELELGISESGLRRCMAQTEVDEGGRERQPPKSRS